MQVLLSCVRALANVSARYTSGVCSASCSSDRHVFHFITYGTVDDEKRGAMSHSKTVIRAAVIPRQPIARSEAKAVLTRVFELGMFVVRVPNAATLLLQCSLRYDISMF